MWAGTHGEDSPDEQECGSDIHVLAVGNSEDNAKNGEGKSRLDEDGGETGVSLEGIGRKNSSELLADAHELVDNETSDDDVEGDGECCPWDTKIDGAALEEVLAWSGALIKSDNSHG